MNDRLSRLQASRSWAVKQRIDYPVIDTDVHTIDYTPLLEEYVEKYGGATLVEKFRKKSAHGEGGGGGKDWYQQTWEERRYKRSQRGAWWNRPTLNTLDLATYALPELFYERQAEQGSDFSVLFPNKILAPLAEKDPDARRALVRATNHYQADVWRKYGDRIVPVAGIPLGTPQEGIEELEFAVKELGLKVANIPGGVRRPIRALADKYPLDQYPDLAKHITYIDFLGLDSDYDYDPFWAKAIELGVPLTTHFGSQGWTGRASISNYMHNHIGHFADASEAFAKALFFGGVTKRFPKLRVALLEGGADWGARVFFHLVHRYERRSAEGLRLTDPALADRDVLLDLFKRYGSDLTHGQDPGDKEELLVKTLNSASGLPSRRPAQDELLDFAAAGIEKVEDIRERWVDNFFFGSESDDATVHNGFNTKANPLGVKVNAIWSSDVGHWDVPDITDPLADSYSFVESGLITEEDFKSWVFSNPYKFYTESNPDFFKGTVVEKKVKALNSQSA